MSDFQRFVKDTKTNEVYFSNTFGNYFSGLSMSTMQLVDKINIEDVRFLSKQESQEYQDKLTEYAKNQTIDETNEFVTMIDVHTTANYD